MEDKNETAENIAIDLAFKKELQRGAGEKVPDAVVIITKDKVIRYFNRQAELTFGYREEDVIGQPLAILLTEEVKAIHDKYIDERFFNDPRERPMALRGDLEAVDSGGNKFKVEIYLAPYPTSRGTVAIAYIRKTK